MHNLRFFALAALRLMLGYLVREHCRQESLSKSQHLESLNRLAVSFGCSDWQHLIRETDCAYEAQLTRKASLNTSEFNLLCDMELSLLCQQHPKLSLVAIEELATELFQAVLMTLHSPALFAKRAADFGGNPASMDDKNAPGWRLYVDTPGGHLFHSHYPASGKMVALITGCVPGDIIDDYLAACPEFDEAQAVSAAREDYRGSGEVLLCGQGSLRQNEILSLAEACYLAIMSSVEDQCGVSLS